VEVEAREKEAAGCLLFVIDSKTRALASIVEAAGELRYVKYLRAIC
jgi:hypothetical protein